MKYFDAWLRDMVDRRIRKNHEPLLVAIRKKHYRDLFDEIIHIKNWYVTVLLTFALFGLSTLFFHLFKMPKEDEIVSLVEHRAANLSTLAGFSLTVITFLMSNIAVKESYAYQTVLERTKFFAVVIVVLTTLACFVSIETFNYLHTSGEWTKNLMCSSLIVFIVILVLIGLNFWAALHFTNPHNIDKLVNETLIMNAKKVIHEGLILKYSGEYFRQLMDQRGVNEYNFGMAFDFNPLKFSMKEMTEAEFRALEAKQRYLRDLNINGLNNYLDGKSADGLYYHHLHIGAKTDSVDHYIFVSGEPNDAARRKKLSKLSRWTKKSRPLLAAKDLRAHYDVRLVEYAESGKLKELERLLRGLSELYALQMTYQHDQEFELTNGLINVLQDAINKAIRKKHLECFRLLISFCTDNGLQAIKMRDLKVFTVMLDVYIQIFNVVSLRGKDSSYQEFLPLALDPAGFYELFLYHIAESKRKNPTEIATINRFALQTYRAYNLLFYYMISLKDFEGFKKAAMLLDKPLGDEPYYRERSAYRQEMAKPKVEQDAKLIARLRQQYAAGKALQSLKQRTLFSIKAWIYHLYRWKKLTTSEASGLLESVPLRYQETEDAVDDLYYSRKGIWEFTWQSWVFPEVVLSGEAGISDPRAWLSFGFLAEQIRRYQLPFYEHNLQLEKTPDLSFIISELKSEKAYLAKHLEDWKLLLGVADETDLDRKADAVIGYFENLQAIQKESELENYGAALMKPEAETAFIAKAKTQWHKESGILRLFAGTDTTGQPPAGKFIGINQLVGGVKRFFVDYTEPADIALLNDIGSQAGRQIDELFFETITNQTTPVMQGKLSDIVTTAITSLTGNNKTVDAIFVSATQFYMEQEFLDDARYVEKPFEADSLDQPVLKGWFKGIPVYTTYATTLGRQVIVASFRSAFAADLGVVYDPENFEPDATVIVFTDMEADKLAQNGGQNPPTRRKVLNIMNGVQIKVGIAASFRIIDRGSIVTGILNS